jgi:hypothetical protein
MDILTAAAIGATVATVGLGLYAAAREWLARRPH